MMLKFPFEVAANIKFINNFSKLHSDMGCNKEQLIPEKWASESITFGITF